MLVLTFKAPSNLKIQPRDCTFCALSLPFFSHFAFLVMIREKLSVHLVRQDLDLLNSHLKFTAHFSCWEPGEKTKEEVFYEATTIL